MVGLPWGSRALRVVVLGILTIKKRWIHPAPPLSDAIFWSVRQLRVVKRCSSSVLAAKARRRTWTSTIQGFDGWWVPGWKMCFQQLWFYWRKLCCLEKKLDGKMIKWYWEGMTKLLFAIWFYAAAWEKSMMIMIRWYCKRKMIFV